jgi:hypothetical protein
MAVSFGRIIPKQVKFVPYNGKIADITHADTAKHTLDLETALSETRKIIAIIPRAELIAGTGQLHLFPNEGTSYIYLLSNRVYGTCIIADGTQRLEYALSVANDDWDLYCVGYVVEA